MRWHRRIGAALAALLLLIAGASAQTDFAGFGFSNPIQFSAGGFTVGPLPAVAATSTTYAAGAVNFDGTNDYTTRGAQFTNQANSKSGILSVWLKFAAGGDGGEQSVFQILGPGVDFVIRFAVKREATNKFSVDARTSAGTQVLIMTSTTSWTSANGWIHFLLAWNLATPVARMYVNDVDDETAGSTETDGTIEYAIASGDNYFGTRNAAGIKLNADVAEFYFAPGQFLDISSSANRRKFITAGLKPVNLGADCSTPTGTAPRACFKHTTGAAATDFAVNLGDGGNMTITGTLTQSATSPYRRRCRVRRPRRSNKLTGGVSARCAGHRRIPSIPAIPGLHPRSGGPFVQVRGACRFIFTRASASFSMNRALCL